jgi:hypothetical protein
MTLAVTLQRKWSDARFLLPGCTGQRVFSNFRKRLFRYAKNAQYQEAHMPIVTALALSMLLLTVTGCVTASDPPAAKQETGKKDSTKKAIKHDERKAMNEESENALR